jgi:8-oxo-dGTP pyrophosphatase MutT (NUDIX family)
MNTDSTEYRATAEWPYCISCGGVVFRDHEGERQYALLYRHEQPGLWDSAWHLPKGTLHHNETIESCALREIEEESGLKGEILVYLGSLKHDWYSERSKYDIDKAVHYFLVRYGSGDGSAMDDEHDVLEWFNAPMAMEKLNSVPKKQEAQIIQRAEQYFELGL